MILCFVFSALIVALDQFFKQWIVRTIDMGEKGPEIIPGIIGLTRWENDGAMLNILSGQQWLLAGVALVASVLLVMIILRYNEGFWGTLGLAAVLGGTVGNLFDRVFNDGKVIDMFRTLFVNFPIFNIADIFITLGFFTFLIHFIFLTFKVGKEGSQDGDRLQGFSEEQDLVNAIDVSGFSNAAAYPEYNQSQAQYAAPASGQYAAQPYETQQPVQQPYVAQQPYAAQQPYMAQPAAGQYAAPAGQQQQYAAQPYAAEQPVAQQQYAAPYDAAAGQYAAPAATAQDYGSVSSGYDPATDTTPEISLTMEALEAELGSLDVDYDVDELLREYGIEDDDLNV